jgi:hypothetical protein
MIDIDGLEKVYAANVDVPEKLFDMRTFESRGCRTTHCLIGNFIVKNPGDVLKMSDEEAPTRRGIAERFGFPDPEWNLDVCYLFYNTYGKSGALARLRKFIDDEKARRAAQ